MRSRADSVKGAGVPPVAVTDRSELAPLGIVTTTRRRRDARVTLSLHI